MFLHVVFQTFHVRSVPITPVQLLSIKYYYTYMIIALHYFLDSVVFGYPIFFLLTKRFMIGIVQILDYLSNGVLKIIIDTTRVQMYS